VQTSGNRRTSSCISAAVGTSSSRAAEDGAVEVVPQAHRAHVNITYGLRRIIDRAGLKPWPQLRLHGTTLDQKLDGWRRITGIELVTVTKSMKPVATTHEVPMQRESVQACIVSTTVTGHQRGPQGRVLATPRLLRSSSSPNRPRSQMHHPQRA
jgi:hypothetical protein